MKLKQMMLSLVLFGVVGCSGDDDAGSGRNLLGYDVLILSDDAPNVPGLLQVALEETVGAGRVMVGPLFYEWDPTSDNADLNHAIDPSVVVVILEGYEEGEIFTPGADAALLAHVNAGGKVVRSEWSAYSEMSGAFQGDLMPVVWQDDDYWETADGYDYAPDSDDAGFHWDFVDADSSALGLALRDGVTDGFMPLLNSGSSEVDAVDGATVHFESTLFGPMVTSLPVDGDGMILHINTDWVAEYDCIDDNDCTPGYSPVTILDSNMVKILQNAVKYWLGL